MLFLLMTLTWSIAVDPALASGSPSPLSGKALASASRVVTNFLFGRLLLALEVVGFVTFDIS